MIGTLQAVALSSGVAVLLGFGGGWQVREWRCQAAEADRLEAEADVARVRRLGVDRQAELFEEYRAADAAAESARAKETDRAIDANPAVYAAACLDDAGLRLLNDDIRAASRAAGQSAGAVPGPAASGVGRGGQGPAVGP